jgi:hypothetical protein
VFDAVLPRYPQSRDGTVVDLNALAGNVESDHLLSVGAEKLERQVDSLLAARGEAETAGHISVLALGPMPLLIYLGSLLPNTIPTDLYQRHRDTERWTWKENEKPVSFKREVIQEGGKDGQVTVIVDLSGTIPPDALPGEIRDGAWLYRLTLADRVPDPTFLSSRGDLDRFKAEYQALLGDITARHGILPEINMVPAVPAPIAILIGRERLPKVHPALRVFDRNGSDYGFSRKVGGA